ncbi:uncharacterized protein LOC129310690 [Prosopis cineraria]|uniref:uncharacterized protein LOC129310690 n=1 Tax=Prosopis cineraria TaxID=364024 RepID=UPI002410A3DB|nr:uncharacterized protein LOC129310690 [Prosopis cineraria]
MGPESNLAGSSSTSSPSSKRTRDPEEEVYLDNFHSHKRYLSEIMASSLNGLTVGDSLPDNLLESPARSDSMLSVRDEMSSQYSPMSEDSDESRYCETTTNSCSSQPESRPTSPVSPYRYQRPLSAFSSAPSSSSNASHGSTVPQPRQRGSDSEGRFPSSPSDICHSADLRRAALLRSVQMRAQPPGDPEDRPCSFMKSLDDYRECQIDECPSMGMLEPEFNQEKPSSVLNMNVKSADSGG